MFYLFLAKNTKFNTNKWYRVGKNIMKNSVKMLYFE